MARTLSLTTNSSSQITVSTADYGTGAGDQYSFYSAAGTAANWPVGEAGLTAWFHGPYSTTNAMVPKYDSTNDSGGLYNWDGGSGSNSSDLTTACTGTGSFFAAGSAASGATTPPGTSNGACQIVHIKGATGTSYQIESCWIIWANGRVGLQKKTVSSAGNNIFGSLSILTAAVTAPTSSNANTGGTAVYMTNGSTTGVVAMTYQSTNLFGNVSTTTGNNGNGTYYSAGNPSSVVQSGALFTYQFYTAGRDSGLSTSVRDAMRADYVTHGAAGTSPGTNGLLITTGAVFGTTGVWTDVVGTSVTGRSSAFDEQYGAYRIAASSNHVNVGGTTTNWGIDGTTVTARYRPCFIISGWTDSSATPTVTLGGTAQTSGTDFIAYNDTGASVLWLCLLKDITSTSNGALDITAGSSSTAWSRSGSASETPTASPTRSAAYSRTPSSSATPSASPSRLAALLRSASAAQTATATVSRIKGFIRSATAALTATLGTLTRLVAYGRTSSASMTPTSGSTRAVAAIRAATAALGATISISRAAGTLRSAAASLTPTVLLTRSAALARLVGSTLTPSVLIARTSALARSASAALTSTALITRIQGWVRAASTSMTPSVLVSRAAGAVRTGSAMLVSSATLTRIQGWVRSGAATLASSVLATRASALSRLGSATLGASALANRAAAYRRSASSLLTPLGALVSAVKNGGSTAWNRTTSAAMSAAAGVSRASALVRSGTASGTPSALVTRSVALIRTGGATLGMSVLVTRASALIRGGAAGLSSTGGSTRSAGYTRLSASALGALGALISAIKNSGSTAWTRSAGATLGAVAFVSRAAALQRRPTATLSVLAIVSRTASFARLAAASFSLLAAGQATKNGAGALIRSALAVPLLTRALRALGLTRAFAVPARTLALHARSQGASMIAVPAQRGALPAYIAPHESNVAFTVDLSPVLSGQLAVASVSVVAATQKVTGAPDSTAVPAAGFVVSESLATSLLTLTVGNGAQTLGHTYSVELAVTLNNVPATVLSLYVPLPCAKDAPTS